MPGPMDYVYGLITGGSGALVLGGIIMWLRFKRRDNAVALKAEAEAFHISSEAMSDGWQDLVAALNKIRGVEQNAFEKIVAEERKRITVLEEKVYQYQIKMDTLIKAEEQCQRNLYSLTQENKRITEELLFIKKLTPGTT